MAAASAIAEINAVAVRDLQRAMTHISEALDVSPTVLPVFRGDPAYQSAMQLKALAAWSQQVALGVMDLVGADVRPYRRVIEQDAIDYSAADEDTLRAEALKRGIQGADQMARNDLAPALRASDSEKWAAMDEQDTPLAAPDYEAMTKAEAIKRAEAAGMPKNAKTTKAEAVDYLLAAAGISEDQQAALDSTGGLPQPENE